MDRHRRVDKATSEDTGDAWLSSEYGQVGEPKTLTDFDSPLSTVRVAVLEPRTWYAVVDEIVDSAVKVTFDEWPTTDRVGRLIFSGDTRTHWFQLTEIREYADRGRDASRRLRIGDVFAIYTSTPSQPDAWESVADVTSETREKAKVASFAARVGTAHELDSDLGERDDEPPAPPNQSAAPTI